MSHLLLRRRSRADSSSGKIQVQLSIRSVDKPQSLIWILLGTCSVLLLSALKLDAQQEVGHPALDVCRCKMQDLLQASPCHEASTYFRHLSWLLFMCQTQVHQHQYTKAVLQQRINLCIHARLSRMCCVCITWVPALYLMQQLTSNCIVLCASDIGLC